MENVKTALSGYAKYKGREGHFAFVLHRISGLATLVFLAMHIVTTATVYFASQWYERLIQVFRNPAVMLAEIVMAFFVIYHGVNGLRIAWFDLFRPDLWAVGTSRRSATTTLIIAFVLWLPALSIMGYNLLRYGFNFSGGK